MLEHVILFSARYVRDEAKHRPCEKGQYVLDNLGFARAEVSLESSQAPAMIGCENSIKVLSIV